MNQIYSEIFLSFSVAFAISLLLIPQIIKIAHSRDMHDIPDERKIHSEKIPTFGGIGIFFGFIISLLVFSFDYTNLSLQYLFGGILIIVIVGMRDDFLPLSPFWKLIGQLGAASLIIIGQIRFHSLMGLFGIFEISDILSYAITLYTIIVITNSFNLIDGIDGLAGSVSLVVFIIFGSWFAYHEEHALMIFCFSICGAILAFLKFNISPAKIFMGDTGSLLLGFSVSAMVLLFFQKNTELPETDLLKLSNPISIASALIVYPLYDTLRVFAMRLAEGRSPFSPDRNHLHHYLIQLFSTHTSATLCIVFTQICFVCFAFICGYFGVSDQLTVLLIVILAYTCGRVITFLHKRKWSKKTV